ncbi:class Ia ribonucleoside-diphosphate reductase subunit beta [Aestuariirhabdus litorea]|uniref:ribonucleoside-diphosphate reductase n=1 Tax=Aestuariirhabdus litorea TaxID=2528527 RepID=A0A3P3VRG7_9GAMM|nr:class Ia ribonucleoside-diphosphate reductase subunit beta [Aestuariirhabdus litorea]RRJ84119.1 ribonucleotide-diphosphate reductase subunit beta [Aestuariirhabdus litorea]RWW97339.1 ribonucleotide-diphosphate reductase subunit beta [Endozoicomonadaceae bacterium GTF-13]
MRYTTFNTQKHDQLKEPMFLGQPVNVLRFDEQRYPIFEKLTDKQLSFFWRPEEIDVSKDRLDFQSLPEHERHIFLANLRFQTLADAAAGRSIAMATLPAVSLPELEAMYELFSAVESAIHSKSYSHIIRNVFDNPTEIFNGIIEIEEIVERSTQICRYYDDLIEYSSWFNLLGEGNHSVNGERKVISLPELKKKLFLAILSLNIMEGVRFYVSFACSFAFAERSLMEGNAKIIKLIARDEALHTSAGQHVINTWRAGKDDPQMAEIIRENETLAYRMFDEVVRDEKAWAEYLFKDGSMIGLNAEILKQYVEYIANQRMQQIGLTPKYQVTNNPLPWMNTWLVSDNVQVAPQETEITSYLVGAIDRDVDGEDFGDFAL